jgi:hypothetical protein
MEGSRDDVLLLLEDAADPVHHLRCPGGGTDGEGVAVLVAVIPGLVGAKPGQGVRHRGRFQADGGTVIEVDYVRHAPSGFSVVVCLVGKCNTQAVCKVVSPERGVDVSPKLAALTREGT